MSLAPKEITPLAAFSYQQVKLFKIYSPVPFIRAAVSRKEWTPVLPRQQSFLILFQPELQFTHCLKNISSSVMWGQFLSPHSALTLQSWWSFLANFRSILFYGRQSSLSSFISHRLAIIIKAHHFQYILRIKTKKTKTVLTMYSSMGLSSTYITNNPFCVTSEKASAVCL